MRLTFRGRVAIVIVVVGVANAVAYGPRTPNTVTVPVATGLVVGTVQAWRVSPPHTERVAPDGGFPGETHTILLDIDVDRPFPTIVSDIFSSGLDGDTMIGSVAGDGCVNYEVTYRGRGLVTLSPAIVITRDILSLLSKSFTVGGAAEVLIFPRIRLPRAAARRDLSALTDAGRINERAGFDRLREYIPDDPPRDIHWKSGAKSGNPVVKAYGDRVTANAVRVSTGVTDGHENAAAKAATTLCCAFLDVGVPVHLTSPAGVVEATPGNRRCVPVYLSRLRLGSVPDKTVEVVVSDNIGKARVALGGRETASGRLYAEHDTVDGSNRNPASRIGTRQPDSEAST